MSNQGNQQQQGQGFGMGGGGLLGGLGINPQMIQQMVQRLQSSGMLGQQGPSGGQPAWTANGGQGGFGDWARSQFGSPPPPGMGGGSAMSGLALPPGSPITPPGIAGGQMPPGFGGPLPNQSQPAPNRGIRPDMGPTSTGGPGSPVGIGGPLGGPNGGFGVPPPPPGYSGTPTPSPTPGTPMLPNQFQPAPNFLSGFNTLPAFAQGSVRGPQTGMQIMGSPQNQGGGLMNMMGL